MERCTSARQEGARQRRVERPGAAAGSTAIGPSHTACPTPLAKPRQKPQAPRLYSQGNAQEMPGEGAQRAERGPLASRHAPWNCGPLRCQPACAPRLPLPRGVRDRERGVWGGWRSGGSARECQRAVPWRGSAAPSPPPTARPLRHSRPESALTKLVVVGGEGSHRGEFGSRSDGHWCCAGKAGRPGGRAGLDAMGRVRAAVWGTAWRRHRIRGELAA